jgi:hypothetical protein
MIGGGSLALIPSFPVTDLIFAKIAISVGDRHETFICDIPDLTPQQRKAFNERLIDFIKCFHDEVKKVKFIEQPGSYSNQCIGSFHFFLRKCPDSDKYECSVLGSAYYCFLSLQDRINLFEKISNFLIGCHKP